MDVTWLTISFSRGLSAAALAAGEPSGTSTTQIVLLVLAVVCLTSLMLSTRRRVQRQRHMPQTSIRERFAESRQAEEAAEDLEQTMLQLDQLSRQIHGRLDTKLARLEALIRQADERIAILSRRDRAPTAPPGLEVTLGEVRPDDGAGRPGDRRHATIHRLADQGVTPVDIAAQTGRTTGEVELILSLRRAVSTVPSQEETIPTESAS